MHHRRRSGSLELSHHHDTDDELDGTNSTTEIDPVAGRLRSEPAVPLDPPDPLPVRPRSGSVPPGLRPDAAASASLPLAARPVARPVSQFERETTRVNPPSDAMIARSNPRAHEADAGTIDGYRVDRLLDEGRFASTYRAYDGAIGRKVVIKLVHLEHRDNPIANDCLLREARASNYVGSPSVVDVQSYGKTPVGRAYTVLEHLEGESLADVVARGRLPRADAIAYVLAVTVAVQRIHERGLIHRNLTPKQVFLAQDGESTRVVLTGLGLARYPGDVLSLPFDIGHLFDDVYASPEVRRGERADASSDVYSIGAIAHLAITGLEVSERPAGQEQTLSEHWPEVPTSLELALRAAISVDARRRPAIGVLRDVLEACAETLGHNSLLDRATKTSERMASKEPKVPLRRVSEAGSGCQEVIDALEAEILSARNGFCDQATPVVRAPHIPVAALRTSIPLPSASAAPDPWFALPAEKTEPVPMPCVPEIDTGVVILRPGSVPLAPVDAARSGAEPLDDITEAESLTTLTQPPKEEARTVRRGASGLVAIALLLLAVTLGLSAWLVGVPPWELVIEHWLS